MALSAADQDMDPQPRPRTPGERYEALAFTFCKTATLVLLTQKFALPVSAGLAAMFYILAQVNGKQDTRCILKHPVLIAAFWGSIAVCSLILQLWPLFHRVGPR